jgi:hypothetical protein
MCTAWAWSALRLIGSDALQTEIAERLSWARMAFANSVRAAPPFSNAVSTGDEGGRNYATAPVDVNRPSIEPLPAVARILSRRRLRVRAAVASSAETIPLTIGSALTRMAGAAI